MVIVLDSFPASNVSKEINKKKPGVSDLCHQWINDCEAAGHSILVPAIVYYEVLRELELRQATAQMVQLKARFDSGLER